ncbi:sigma-54-dependent Fis family transcriptional regulator [bacterium]|nr:sigma-54-dependent Fis family transcriptional regulator [bacterium]MCB9476187.1 sigma-54-dependent Fis family transcriptional regulator [Deltaproteobacteria bacterium]
MKVRSILSVDDDESHQRVIEAVFRGRYDVTTRASGEEAIAYLEENSCDLVLLDMRLPGMSGIETLRTIKGRWPEVEVVMVTAMADTDTTVNAIKAGAYDYLVKGGPPDLILNRVGHLFERLNQRQEIKGLSSEREGTIVGEMMLGPSAASAQLQRELNMAARSSVSCLLIGETGTGKDLAARYIHAHSDRASKPLVTVNLPAIPENLIASTLFGHTRGAFTGAVSTQEGKFELADGGTIFLDEIGDLPLENQASLLRAIENGECEQVGSSRKKIVDVRVIAATCRDLDRLVAENRFRRDLLYRLNVLPVRVPALRERIEDIPFLCSHFLRMYSKRHKKPIVAISPLVIQAFERHEWLGNIREFSHVIERMVIYAEGDSLELSDLPSEFLASWKNPDAKNRLIAERDAYERKLIIRALERHGFNQSATAKYFGMSRQSFLYRMRALGLDGVPRDALV